MNSVPANETLYIKDDDISINWSASDFETGIESCEWSLGNNISYLNLYAVFWLTSLLYDIKQLMTQ